MQAWQGVWPPWDPVMRREWCQPHPVLENLPPPTPVSTAAPQDRRPGLPPVGSEVWPPSRTRPPLRPPPTPQTALLQWDRTLEVSGPTAVAHAGRHPGDRGHRRRRGPLHRAAGPAAAGGHRQGRSACEVPLPCPAREGGVWVPGLREGQQLPGFKRPFLHPACCWAQGPCGQHP